MRLLEITNDFPPTLGGIENYIYSIVARWEPADVVVLTRATHGSEAVDATLDAEVRRERVATLLPTPGFQAKVRELGVIQLKMFPQFPPGFRRENAAQQFEMSLNIIVGQDAQMDIAADTLAGAGVDDAAGHHNGLSRPSYGDVGGERCIAAGVGDRELAAQPPGGEVRADPESVGAGLGEAADFVAARRVRQRLQPLTVHLHARRRPAGADGNDGHASRAARLRS